MGEILNVTLLPKNKTNLTTNEVNWMQTFNFSVLDTYMVKRKLEVWEIRLDKSQFKNRIKERNIFKLFFDGASKGNPGMVGGGGVIICPEGKIEMEYYWNIGNDSNNMVEAYGMWKGIKQLKEKGVEEAIVFGDSQIIIQAMNEVS